MMRSKHIRYWACPLAVPMPSNVNSTDRVRKTRIRCYPSLPSLLIAAMAQAALGHCCPASAPTAAVCSAAPKESMVPAGLKGSTMSPWCVHFFLICFPLCKISGSSDAILHLDRYSRYLQDCKTSEAEQPLICPLLIWLLLLSVVYSSPRQDRSAAIKVLQLTYF